MTHEGKKIVLIEDEVFLLELLSMQLKQEGFVAVGAVGGKEGLMKVKEEKPDLILLDLILPDMDGYEVLQQLKKNPETKDIPVFIVSNLSQKEDIERGKNLGAVDFYTKAHHTPKEIIDNLKKFLQ